MVKIGILVLAVLALSACRDGTGVKSDVSETTWLSTRPIQCLGNPWEQDWIKAHGGDPANYPHDPKTPGLDPKEIEIIEEYYSRFGVSIFEVADVRVDEHVCLACSCPALYKLFVRVDDDDVAIMERLGFERERPPLK